MSIAEVTRELLVRYLDTWTPTALHQARRATFAQAWGGPADIGLAEAALRVFAEFTDRLRGRKLAVVLVAPQTGELTGRLDAVVAELGSPAELSVHAVPGDPAQRLAVALKAAGAAGAPLLAYLDSGEAPPVGPVAVGRPAELILVAPPGGWAGHRTALRDAGTAGRAASAAGSASAGFTLSAGVELVEGAQSRLLAFATSSAKSLEAFKNCLWAVDEYAGVRYRDPGDPEGHLMDISLRPDPGPLRRELLAHLDAAGGCTVTELRHFTLTETIFRAADTVRVLTALLAAGAVTRTPESGRLSGDVVISLR
jgi:hypothetical protein